MAITLSASWAHDVRRLVREPWFVVPAAIKLALILFVRPEIAVTWFIPFVQRFVLAPGLDPWSDFLASGGDPLAFPYGPVMLVVLAPTTAIAAWAGHLASIPLEQISAIGFAFAVFCIDAIALLLLLRLFPGHWARVIKLYWLSPIAIFVMYWHGQLDVIPVAFLLMTMLLLREQKFLTAGLIFGVTISTKLSMVLAGPFLVIYLFRNNRLRRYTPSFLLGAFAAALILQALFLASPGVQQMVLGTREAAKVFDVVIGIDGIELYVLPLIYLLALYGTWRVQRISFDLLVALLGLSFFLVLLLTPASPGWYLWIVPFLVHHQLSGGRHAIVLTAGFSVLLIVFHLFRASGADIPWLGLDLSQALAHAGAHIPPRMHSLWLTLTSATGVVLVLQMLREGIQGNDYYRLSRRPLMIGISGDSGTGKDTLAMALQDLFGSHSVANLSGDDYHLWDRHRPMWRAVTHLNPRANDLEKFNADVLRLADGRAVSVRHYDHGTGRYTKPRTVRQNDVLIVSGLHALYSPTLRQRCDVKVFLDMDESLRQAFKVRRDVGERGHAPEKVRASIEARLPDAKRYIKPQALHADLVFSLRPARSLDGEILPNDSLPVLELGVLVSDCLFYDDMLRALIGICGLSVKHHIRDDGISADFTIEGDVSAEDIELAARNLLSHVDELLDLTPAFKDGMLGVMQLFVLAQSAQALRTRFQ